MKPTGKDLFRAQVEKEDAERKAKEDKIARDTYNSKTVDALLRQAGEEGTTYADLSYNKGQAKSRILYNFGNQRAGGYEPPSPLVYDTCNHPIGYVDAWKSHMSDLKDGNHEAKYEVWIPRDLWGNGFEMAALTKSMTANPWDDPGDPDYKGIISTVYVHKDNADFSAELLENGWIVDHIDEKADGFRSFTRIDDKVKPGLFTRKGLFKKPPFRLLP